MSWSGHKKTQTFQYHLEIFVLTKQTYKHILKNENIQNKYRFNLKYLVPGYVRVC